MKETARLEVVAGLLSYSLIRRVAFELGLKVTETKLGWLQRGFVLEGPADKVSTARDILDHYASEDE